MESSPSRVIDSARSGYVRPDYGAFIARYKGRLNSLFHGEYDIDRLSLQRGLPDEVLAEIRACEPLTVWIPSEFGGRGGHTAECIGMLSASSYESLALSLTFGINGALFLQPLARYGSEAAKRRVYREVVEHKAMGGLMITEPDYGSDALNMKTAYVEEAAGYRIKGTKHWGGLTGMADFWLLTARAQDADGQLGRDIDFFVCQVDQPGQAIEVEEYFENLGLYMIPYGRNRLDLVVPHDQRLIPDSTGIKMMLDILHRSRIEFPGMAMGFLHRIMDEGIRHCRERFVGGKALLEYDQVQKRLSRLQAFFTACSAMCAYTSNHIRLGQNLAKHGLEANCIKTVATDMMQEAAQSLLQLVGGKGYRLDHIAGRATVDSRPFQIFEGSNDILYQQMSEAVVKAMKRLKEPNFGKFISGFSVTERSGRFLGQLLDFQVDFAMPQRKLVELGRAIGQIFAIDITLELGERGFRSDLIENCVSILRDDVATLLQGYRNPGLAAVEVDYSDRAGWVDLMASTG